MATMIWTGVALWLGLNAAFVAYRMYVTRPERAVAPVLVWNRRTN
jgi:hypothetical protein